MKTLSLVDNGSRVPRHLQAWRILAEAIRKGKFPPGTPLPDSREIAVQMNASLITTRRAIARLVKDGWLGRNGPAFTVTWLGLDGRMKCKVPAGATVDRGRVPVFAKSA